MKDNEQFLKQLYCDVLIKSLNAVSIDLAIKDAEKAIDSFSKNFESKDILKPLDETLIKIWNPTQETSILNGLVKMRNYRFKGCSFNYSLQKIPSMDLGGFPYWLIINDNGTLQIETKNPN